jgi:hypothetical protein
MTINDILKARGLDETAITGVLEDLKANKLFFSSEENMDIRYGKLKTQHDGLNQQLTEANALIDTLKKSTKGQEEAQQKITAYEQQVQQLQAELAKTKMLSDAKFKLSEAGGKDIEYLLYLLEKDGELTPDENGEVKGLDDKIAGLQIKQPDQFNKGKQKQIIENRLPEDGNPGGKTVTKEEFNKMGYNGKVALRQENPELYSQLMKG